jgi:hypothetical protein
MFVQDEISSLYRTIIKYSDDKLLDYILYSVIFNFCEKTFNYDTKGPLSKLKYVS